MQMLMLRFDQKEKIKASCWVYNYLKQQSLTFFVPDTDFMGDNFSVDQGWGRGRMVSE